MDSGVPPRPEPAKAETQAPAQGSRRLTDVELAQVLENLQVAQWNNWGLRVELDKLRLAIRVHRQHGGGCQCYPEWPAYVDESLAETSPIERSGGGQA